jgi:glycosyltransferase involved in cell wall biosynthesis
VTTRGPSVRPTRVLRVIARMNVGGPALQVVALAHGLDSSRYDQRLLTGSVDEAEADYLEVRAIELTRTLVAGLGRTISPLDDLRALLAIRREICRFRPDIVHTHTAKAGVLGRVAAISAAVPIRVHTFHGHILHGYFGRWTTRAVIAVERLLAFGTTHFVAVGGQVRDDLLAAGIGRRDRFTVVPPGVDVVRADRSEARERLGLPSDGPVVSFVARLTEVKRPELFIEVAAATAAAAPDAVFAVVGDGPLRGELEQGDIDAVYSASDVVVLTSANEGMPVALIEAAAAGVPVVSTRVGSVAEVVDDGRTGLLVEDVEGAATALLELLGDPARRVAMGEAAAELASERFGRARLVRDIDDLYRTLMERLR